MGKATVGEVLRALPGPAVLVGPEGSVLGGRCGDVPAGYEHWPAVVLFPGTGKACRLYWQTQTAEAPELVKGLLELLLNDLVSSSEAYWFDRLLKEPVHTDADLPQEAGAGLPVRLSALMLREENQAEAERALRELLPELKLSRGGDGLLFLRMTPDRETALETAESVLALIGSELLMDPLLIFGETVTSPALLYRYGQALTQLSAKRYSRGLRGLAGLLGLLPEIAAGAEAGDIIRDLGRMLTPVLEDSELAATAEAFIRNSLSVSETAQGLYLHRNTLVYRLGKIEKLTGLDLKRLDHAMAYALMTAAT